MKILVNIFRVLSGIAMLLSITWVIYDPTFEPAIATVVFISALLASFINLDSTQSSENQTQTISENGIGIQAGGDISINSNNQNK